MWRRESLPPNTVYARLYVPTHLLERLGLLAAIHDPERHGHHQALANPVVKSGRCPCSFSASPREIQHRATCIYYDNPDRCFCEICTGQSPDLREVCPNGARFGAFDYEDGKPCRRNHCYTREADRWRCTRCDAKTFAPSKEDSYVEELSTPPPPAPTRSNKRRK